MLPPKMAAPLALASAFCHVATIAVIGNMHIQPSTLRNTPAGPPRTLLEPPDGDALVSLRARLEGMRDELETMRADKRRSDEQVELLSSRVDGLAEELRATRKSERTQGPEQAEAEQGLNTTHRQMQQGAAGSCDASGVCTARIITRTVVMQSAMSSGGGAPQRGRRSQAAPCDLAAESAAVMDVCCATAGGGHRRAQADCPLPEVCPSARCAEVFQTFYSGCSAELEASPELGAGLAALSASCNELLGGSSLAHQLNLQCTDASLTAEDCVPPCNAEYHGYMLLLNIDGDDSKFSCNLAHGLYSWMGAASEGGYLGADAQSFFSAVVSGAAGSYIVTLTADVGMSTDLTIQLGQDVHISAESGLLVAPRWGSGGFTVQQGGKLALDGIILAGAAVLDRGGTLSVNNCFAGSVGLQLPSALASTGWSGLWNSGTVTNRNGKSFTLVRLDPAQPPGYFSSNVQGEQRYAALCAAAGLHTVTTGQPDDVHREYGYPTYTNCGQYGCIPLADDALSQANPSYAARWVHDTVGWTNIVTDYGMQHHGATVPSNFICLGGTAPANCDQHQDSWDAWALHPVCGMEAIPATGR